MGICLFMIGLAVIGSVMTPLAMGPEDVREHVFITPGPLYPFWLPISFDVIRVPAYYLGSLILGTFISTIGLATVAFPLIGRFLKKTQDE